MARRFNEADIAKIRNKMGENVPVPKVRKKPGNEESRIQKALIQWWAVQCRVLKIPEFLLFAVPNGGWRHVVTAVNLKKEGARSGTPDLFLSVPTKYYHGLYIEMKKKDGEASDAQKEFIDEAWRRGYAACVCHGLDIAQQVILTYLGDTKFEHAT